MKSNQVILHLKGNRYVSIIQDHQDTCEIAIVTKGNRGGVSDVKRYLNTQELAMELLKLNLHKCYTYSKNTVEDTEQLIEDTLNDR